MIICRNSEPIGITYLCDILAGTDYTAADPDSYAKTSYVKIQPSSNNH